MAMGRADWLNLSIVLLLYCILILTVGAFVLCRMRRRVSRALVWALFVGQAFAPTVLVIVDALSDVAAGRVPRQLEVWYALFFYSFTWPVALFLSLPTGVPCLLGSGPC